jgi:cytochrome c-type biogenesis protein CcmH
MISLVIIVVLALMTFAYLAIPLLFPQTSDPLPDATDPVLQELEEERDALFRAIRELDAREDLSGERRDALRARYEAKAAKVLRALDERQAREEGVKMPAAAPARRRGVPYAMLSLLGIMVVSGSLLGGYVLPRVGQDATITTADEARLAAGRDLQALQRAASSEPSTANLLALAEGYWQVEDFDNAQQVYRQIVADSEPVPALAYRQLGLLTLQEDLETGLAYLEQARDADPADLYTLYLLGEVYLAVGRTSDAIAAWESYLAQPGGADDEEVQSRIAFAELQQAADNDPSETNLVALADAYWSMNNREAAANLYGKVLMELNPQHPQALSRIGQMLFFSGRFDDAIGVLERARAVDAQNLDTLLFLGNAHFSLEQYDDAIEVWEDYVARAGGPDQAGRVPSLIENARARQEGVQEGMASTEPLRAGTVAATGADLYAASCAMCHGAAGQGASGPRLAGNPRATEAAFVRRTIENGRGMMPAFGRTLPAEHVDLLITYVTETLAPGGTTGER